MITIAKLLALPMFPAISNWPVVLDALGLDVAFQVKKKELS